MAGYKATYNDLQDMILRDQYYQKCDPSLKTFLKEKGKLSLKEMTKASNDYYDAHGYPKGNQNGRQNGDGYKPNPQDKPNHRMLVYQIQLHHLVGIVD